MAVPPKQPIEPNEHDNEISPEEENYNNEFEDLEDENEVLDNNVDSIQKLFLKVFVKIHGLVHHKLRNHITQLEFIPMSALSVEAWKLIK